jgi:hypothetical protein
MGAPDVDEATAACDVFASEPATAAIPLRPAAAISRRRLSSSSSSESHSDIRTPFCLAAESRSTESQRAARYRPTDGMAIAGEVQPRVLPDIDARRHANRTSPHHAAAKRCPSMARESPLEIAPALAIERRSPTHGVPPLSRPSAGSQPRWTPYPRRFPADGRASPVEKEPLELLAVRFQCLDHLLRVNDGNADVESPCASSTGTRIRAAPFNGETSSTSVCTLAGQA